jgi:ABC-type transporter Mla subunit MlaD
MTRQAQVGAFALIALLLLFGVFYEITNFSTRFSGYRLGVHFQSAAGLQSGALVYFSGVTIGSVDSITLLPDNTVDVILGVSRDVAIPSASRFLIQAPLTGSPNVVIVPPRVPPGGAPASSQPTLARRVLPVAEQPQGTNATTVADLLQEGQGDVRRLDRMLDQMERSEPELLSTLQTTLNNANRLTMTANNAIGSISAQMKGSLAQAGANIVEITNTLDNETKLNSGRINDMLAQFDETSRSMNASMKALKQLATDPDLKGNVIETTRNIAQTTRTIAELAADLRTVTSDPQTQAQLRNTIANLDATMQRANSLLGQLGGKSSVYGVDEGATPYPIPSPGGTPYPVSAPNPPPRLLHLNERLRGIAANLFALQLRIDELGPQKVCCPSPLFSADRGPQTDLNAILLPHASTSVMLGANDIGYGTTANFLLLKNLRNGVRVGGGVLYSRLGILGRFNSHLFGIETRAYDLRRPTVDLYGDVKLMHDVRLFVGERAINHAERRPVYGIQAQIP